MKYIVLDELNVVSIIPEIVIAIILYNSVSIHLLLFVVEFLSGIYYLCDFKTGLSTRQHENWIIKNNLKCLFIIINKSNKAESIIQSLTETFCTLQAAIIVATLTKTRYTISLMARRHAIHPTVCKCCLLYTSRCV